MTRRRARATRRGTPSNNGRKSFVILILHYQYGRRNMIRVNFLKFCLTGFLLLRSHLRRLLQRELPDVNFAVTRPPDAKFGEFSSNAALCAARVLRQSPAQIGQTLLLRLAPEFDGQIELVAGRLNFFMSDHSIVESLERAAREGAHYGSGDALAGKRVLVEYVSVRSDGAAPVCRRSARGRRRGDLPAARRSGRARHARILSQRRHDFEQKPSAG